MAISLQTLNRSARPRPPVSIVYGKPGVGKTTFASFAPNPVFLMTEDGLISPRLQSMPNWPINSRQDLLDALNTLGAEQHEFQTVVIDSIDQLDPHITAAMCAANEWKDINSPGYGKGQVEIVEWWREPLKLVFALRNFKNMGVMMLGHHRQANISPPDNQPYTQFTLTLPEKTARYLVGEADIVAFATHPVHTISDKGKFNQTNTRAITDEATGPVLHVQERGGWVAKNRFDMPPTIPMSWDVFASYIPYYRQSRGPVPVMNGMAPAAAVAVAHAS